MRSVRATGAARARVAAAAALLSAVAACTPRARPLQGAPAPAAVRLPRVELAPGPQRVVFRWRYEEEGFTARGDGVARIAPPDSARLDFFLDGGFGGGWAVLVGEQVSSPGGDVARRLIPPAPMLWAAFGRLALPAAADTTIRTSGDTLRADIRSADRTWRVTLVAGRLAVVEQIVGGRLVERLTRDSAQVRYANLAERRSLAIDVQRAEPAAAFPRAIWTR
jgi:hypothetical protein